MLHSRPDAEHWVRTFAEVRGYLLTNVLIMEPVCHCSDPFLDEYSNCPIEVAVQHASASLRGASTEYSLYSDGVPYRLISSCVRGQVIQ